MRINSSSISNRSSYSGTTALIISNEAMEDIMKIVKSLSETIKNETKGQKGRFLPVLLGTLAASTLGNSLTRKGVIRTGERVIRAG